jgi:hypothetical protein
MGIKRVVDWDFWTDDKVVEDFSPEDKLFMLYLLTNPHTTQLGIYAINKRVMAFEIGYSQEAVSVLLDRFETKYDLIKYSTKTNEVAIKNFLRHSIIKGGKPVEDLLKRELKQVKDKSLISYVFDRLPEHSNLNATVLKVIDYVNGNGNKNVNDNDNDNDNENEVSYHESLYESCNDTQNSSSSTEKQFISDEDRKELLKLMSLKDFNYYLGVTIDGESRGLICKNKSRAEHIKDMAAQDGKLKDQGRRYGKFDAEEAMQNALKRTYGKE